MPSGALVRRLGGDEWQAFRNLRLEALATDPDAFESTYEDEVVNRAYDWTVRLPRRAFAEVDGDLVGMVGWAWDPMGSGPGELIGMWVRPNVRGSGVATLLLDHVVGVVVEREHRQLRLAVRADNDRARRFYEKSRFAVTGEEALGPRSGAPIVWMAYAPNPSPTGGAHITLS